MALVIVFAVFVASYNFKKVGRSSVLQSYQAIYDKIPTKAGKNNFIKQSANLTKAVDPELVDLDSQIISCGASVDSLLSDTPIYENSCVAGKIASA